MTVWLTVLTRCAKALSASRVPVLPVCQVSARLELPLVASERSSVVRILRLQQRARTA